MIKVTAWHLWCNISLKELHDLYCLYFLPKVMVKLMKSVRGHFVMVILVSMHLTECNPGNTIWDWMQYSWNFKSDYILLQLYSIQSKIVFPGLHSIKCILTVTSITKSCKYNFPTVVHKLLCVLAIPNLPLVFYFLFVCFFFSRFLRIKMHGAYL